VSLVEAARQKLPIRPVPLKPTKIIKKSREYNIRDLTLALYNIDYNKKGLYRGYMDGNLDLTGVRDRPQPGEIDQDAFLVVYENGVSNPLSRVPQYAHFDQLLSRFRVEFAIKVSQMLPTIRYAY
jgi:hypothetical protein